MNRAIFLDRDGVLNRANVRDGRPYAPTSLDQFEILPGVADSLELLKSADFRLIVVTNQPDIATKKVHPGVVDAMHQTLLATLPIDDIFVCPHTDRDHCDCRKPKPGMLHAAAEKWQLHLPSCFMVGDRWRDIEAGENAGCATIYIATDYSERRPQQPGFTADNLLEASQWVCSFANTAEEATL